MIAPIATIIFVTAMALSLSVEADSFFHTPTKASAERCDDELSATDDDADETTLGDPRGP